MAEKKEALLYPAIPTKQAQITDDYMMKFYKDKVSKGEISKKDAEDWVAFYRKEKATDKTDMKKFAAIRKEFCKRNFPDLLPKDKAPIDELADFLSNL